MFIDEVVTDLLLQWEDNPALTPEALCENYRGQAEYQGLLAAVVRGMLCLRIAAPFLAPRSTDEDAALETPPTHFSAANQHLSNGAPKACPLDLPAGDVSGPRYRPLSFHAKGGLGEVFRAEDEELHREVALKRIQARHQDNPDSRRRFLVEAEITGQLEHPGIVPVYGLGRDTDGKLFYAMRFVKGQTLDEALQRFHEADQKPGRDPGERGLALRELLNRLIAVCNTVAYAHSRRILHRDLKPANIILGNYGETLVVDWGLAKPFALPDGKSPGEQQAEVALQSTLPENATHLGRAMGTPAYMSPEQAHGLWETVGPASDLFSLGATLYALLTGQAPYQGTDRERALVKARCVDFPPPRQVCPNVPRDLEMICLKCLDKDPARRYSSPKALAEDLERWLADEPVKAYREPIVQRGRRWLRQHRTLVGSSMAALLVTAVCLAGATILLQEAYEQEHLAKLDKEQQWLAATAAEEAARKSEARAKSAQKQSDKMTEFLVAAFRGSDPRVQSSDLKVVAVLDAAVAKLQKEAADDPHLQARLLAAIGETYLGLKEGKKAVAVFEQERQLRMELVGLNHQDTLLCMNHLGSAYEFAGRIDEAVALFEQTLELRRANLGDDHNATLQSKNNLAVAYGLAGRHKESVLLFEESLQSSMAKFGPHDRATLQGMNNLASAYSVDRQDESLALHEKVLNLQQARLGESDPDTLTSMNNLALGYQAAGRIDEALPLFETAVRLRKIRLGLDHPDTLATMSSLAVAYHKAGRNSDSMHLFEETLNLFKTKLGLEHSSTLDCMNNLAMVYRDLGRIKDALPLLEGGLKVRRSTRAPDDLETLRTMHGLAATFISAGRFKDALPLVEETWNRRQAILGLAHRDTLLTMNELAVTYNGLGRAKDALPLLELTLTLQKATSGVENSQTLLVMDNLGATYYAVGRLPDCLSMLEETLSLRQAKFGAGHSSTLRNMNDLGNVYLQSNRPNDALPLFNEGLTLNKTRLGREDLSTAQSMYYVAAAYLDLGQPQDAEPLLRDSLAVREKKEPQQWATFVTRSKLGICLLDQNKYSDAEPFLLQAHANMKLHSGAMNRHAKERFTEVVAHLVKLYEATGQTDSAEKWSKELERARQLEKDGKK